MKHEKLMSLLDGCLRGLYPDAACALDWKGDPWRLLVMARLSARCTDRKVNEVSRDLFALIPDPASACEAPVEKIAGAVRQCGLYNEKAMSIKQMAGIIVSDHGGRIPSDEEGLLSLPGVGRKIANLMLGELYRRGGMVCDTHCMRVCGRIGFYPESLKDPAKIEKILNGCTREEERCDLCHRIVQFGRDWCPSRDPGCDSCPAASFCAHAAAAR